MRSLVMKMRMNNSIKFRIQQAKNLLTNSGVEIKSKNWQSIKSPDIMVEICNIYFKMHIPNKIKKLQKECDPDLPWAEDHFLERINGKSLNPGNQYKNWPYYRKSLDDNRFRSNDGTKFSHTYMERYWPPSKPGIRYFYGNLNDIIDRLKMDPYTRQAYLSVWHPEDQSNNNVRLPCSLGYWFAIRNKKLYCTYHIRSCDIVRHFKNDIYMTSRLVQFIADRLKVGVGNLDMWIGSFHIFKSELWKIKTKE